MNDLNSSELQYVLATDLHRAVPEIPAQSKPEQEHPALTKAKLAEMLFDQVGLNKREAKDLIDAFFDEIHTAQERGETVKLSSFGNFQLRDKQKRPGRNPKTGEVIPIPARCVVTFHACQQLKVKCQGRDR